MDENEMIVEESTENTEATAEETTPATEEVASAPAPRVFTQDEVNEIVSKRLARSEARIKKEYDRKYGELETVLKAGTGEETVEGMTSKFRSFYTEKGLNVPQRPTYSKKDEELLANAEAQEIIALGDEEVVDETDRLARLGVENMTSREKAVFKVLAAHREKREKLGALAEIGVTEEEYYSKEYQDFVAKFDRKTPIREIDAMYRAMHKPKDIEPIGSMKNGNHEDTKTYYSPEDVDKLTSADLDNPTVMKNVRESMKSWGRKQ